MTCGYKDCERPAETALVWVEVGNPIEYCEQHAKQAQEMFPDLVDELDDSQEVQSDSATA